MHVSPLARLGDRRPDWRLAASQLGRRVKGLGYLPKWLVLASVIGAIAGLGAVVFYETLAFATHVFLGLLAGYHVPTPAGEGNHPGSPSFVRAWAIPLVVILGALASGFLVFTFAPEAEGHGTDAAIDAVHHNPRGIRLRAVVVKIVASALTIGSGGSGGREGPTAQISAGFGSLLARLLDLSPEDGRIAVSVGIGSGIGAIFSAPLGGAVLAADIVYREDFEYEALLPGVFASIVAYAIFGAVYGYQPLFAMPGGYHFHQPIQLLWFAILGVLAGFIGLLYSKSFYGLVALSHRLPFSAKLRPALGGALVGLIALGLPEVLGTGYGWVQKGLSDDLAHVPLYIIIALPLARIAATALSIGTGGSGGVFGPGMVIGAFTGLALWRVLLPLVPGVGHDPAPFVVVGMMAVFGGIARAPLAVMIMVAQMTGSVALLGPAMVAVAISHFIVARAGDSIYRSQLGTRADSAAGRLRFGLPMLASLRVGDVASTPRVIVGELTPAGEALGALQQARVPGAPVVDRRGTYLGTVDSARLSEAAEADPGAPAASVLDAAASSVAATAPLDVGLEALVQTGDGWVTVTDGSRRVVGIMSTGELVLGYRRALDTNLARISTLGGNAVAVEETIGDRSALAGQQLRAVALPPGTVIVTLSHDNELVFASGSTALGAGDVVSALTNHENAESLRALIRGPEQSAPSAVRIRDGLI